eukprot:12763978-Ditylum_brightwellii.AAC.1
MGTGAGGGHVSKSQCCVGQQTHVGGKMLLSWLSQDGDQAAWPNALEPLPQELAVQALVVMQEDSMFIAKAYQQMKGGKLILLGLGGYNSQESKILSLL